MPHALHRLVVPVVALTVALAGTLAVTSPGVEAGVRRTFKPQVARWVAPGIKYQRGVMYTTGGRRQSVRVVTVWPRHPRVGVRSLLSNRMVLGRQRVTSTARMYSRPAYRVMAATNGDMSRRGRSDAYAAPSSMHVAGGELMVSQSCANPQLGVDPDGTVHMAMVRARLQAFTPGTDYPSKIHRVNTHRDDKAVVLFTNRFGPSTRTRYGGREVVLRMTKNRLSINDRQRMRVIGVRRAGNTRLRAGRAVLSSAVKTAASAWVWRLRRGQTIEVATDIVNGSPRCGSNKRKPGWDRIVEAQGGTHFSLFHGRNMASTAAGDYVAQAHPKTGLGITRDGRILMVTVDGRQGAYSQGVTMGEMGQLMKQLGAISAINLDGGGSTSMTRRVNGRLRVDNRPSDGRERPMTQTFAAVLLPPRPSGDR
jgi:hypothetical protein